ncbi:MAG: peptidase, partial [Massilia sp.]|nr:peptidase [Massilia sp.]
MKPASIFAICLSLGCAIPVSAQSPAPVVVNNPADPIATLVGQLDLEKYKATIKGLTQFGDRRQGTERNRQALDWIEAKLKSYGCTNTERLQFQFTQPAPRPANAPAQARPPAPSGGRG